MKLIVALLTVVVLGLSVTSAYMYLQAIQARTALCGQRLGLQESVAGSRKYLRDVAAGKRTPIDGITEADVKAGIVRQQNTISAYADIDCD